MTTKKISLNELRTLVKQIIKEEVNNESQIKQNINKLSEKDLGWSTQPNIGLSIQFDWDNVDENLLQTQLLNLIKKVNPNVDLEKKKMSLSRGLYELNDRLYSASQKSFSVERGLKDFFEQNLQIFI
jgi:hypothetical protein